MALSRKTPMKRGTSTLKKTSGFKQRPDGKPVGSAVPCKLSGGGKLRAAKRSKEEVEQRKQDIEAMWVLFNQHWNIQPHRCTLCKKWLNGENLSVYHHHVLGKAIPRYSHLKYEIGNLQMLCWSCHSGVENVSIDNSEWVKKVKEKYNIL